MEWVREGRVSLPTAPGEPDAIRAWSPWVLEEPDGTLRMWYTGDDGTTSRILAAVRPPGADWERLGLAIDAGFAGDTDSYGAESPCVVKTPGGYLMVYGGFDGDVGRLHMATSSDAIRWEAQGTFIQRGSEDDSGANHPRLWIDAERWWLYFTGYSRSGGTDRSTILAAVSDTGASWDRVGPVLEPLAGEAGVSHPCVLEVSRKRYLFYASEVAGSFQIALGTSSDGIEWDRRGTVLAPGGGGPDGASAHTPCAIRRNDGSVAMWYSGLPAGDDALGYRICAARFPGPWSA